jgi:hypothetical protein
MCLSGEYKSKEARATADWLVANVRANCGGSYFFYGCYYQSQAMYQAGGKYWQFWNENMTPALMAMQQRDGSWPRGTAGEPASTAFALLALQINYSYLPIYQR